MNNKIIKFIDLFAGLGGTRIAFEKAVDELGLKSQCVLTSEIKESAISALKKNFNHENLLGDIKNIQTESIPDFDILLGGFPCQSFSTAGKQLGFLDTRGTLFFEIERIIKAKNPYGFILENVEGLVKHDLVNTKDDIGRTLTTIIKCLQNLNYKVTWKLLDSQYFGVPQTRKRVYIVGTKNSYLYLENFPKTTSILKNILETGKETINSKFTNLLLSHYKPEELYGKSIKDKRGGDNNIHSWDIELRGKVSPEQIIIIEKLFKERRKKKWAEEIGIDWMDGMPLTLNQISTFHKSQNLEFMLEDLVEKKYLEKEHPKKLSKVLVGNVEKRERVQDETKPIGYNIVSGKLSFEFTKILNPNDVAPTLVAMDVNKLGVIDNGGIRRLTTKECLALFGYPEDYDLTFLEKEKGGKTLIYDLIGNTVVIPVIKNIALRLLEQLISL